MKTFSLCSTVFALSMFALAACGGDDDDAVAAAGSSGTAGTDNFHSLGGASGSTSGSSGTAGTAGTGGTAGAAGTGGTGGTTAAACNSFEFTPIFVDATYVAQTAPAPSGGEPQNGTYKLTSIVGYTGPGGSTSGTAISKADKFTLATGSIDGAYDDKNDDAGVYRYTSHVAFNADFSYNETPTCPDDGAAAGFTNYSFITTTTGTGTVSTLLLFSNNAGLKFVSTYTKQ